MESKQIYMIAFLVALSAAMVLILPSGDAFPSFHDSFGGDMNLLGTISSDDDDKLTYNDVEVVLADGSIEMSELSGLQIVKAGNFTDFETIIEACDGTTVCNILVPNGTYEGKTVDIKSNTNLYIYGDLKLEDSADVHFFRIQGREHVNIFFFGSDLDANRDNQASNDYEFINIQDSSYVSINGDAYIHDSLGVGISFDNSSFFSVTDISGYNIWASNASKPLIGVGANCTQFIVENIKCHTCNETVDLGDASGNYITDGIVSDIVGTNISQEVVDTSGTRRIVIDGVSAVNALNAVRGSGCSYNNINNVQCFECYRGIDIVNNSDHVTISDITLVNSTGSNAIRLNDIEYLTMSNINIVNPARWGISSETGYWLNYSSISNVVITGLTGTDDGISFEGVNNRFSNIYATGGDKAIDERSGSGNMYSNIDGEGIDWIQTGDTVLTNETITSQVLDLSTNTEGRDSLTIDQDNTSSSYYAVDITTDTNGGRIVQSLTLGGATNYFEPNYPTYSFLRGSSSRGANIKIGNSNGGYYIYGTSSLISFQDNTPSEILKHDSNDWDFSGEEVKDIAELEVDGISGDGSGKAVCIKADGYLGTCSDAVGAGGTCTCG